MGCPAFQPAGQPLLHRTAASSQNSGFLLFFYVSQLLVAETIVFTSWKHLQNFRLTASQKVAAKGEGGDFQTVQTLSSPTLLIFALILTCKWNQRILCDWTQSNQTRQPSSFARKPNSILCICLQGYSTKLKIGKLKKGLKKRIILFLRLFGLI